MQTALSHADAVKAGKRTRRLRTINRYMFVIPGLLLFFVFTILPLLVGAFYSLTNYNMIQPWSFVGLENFKTLILEDDLFLTAVQNTLVYAIIYG